MSEKKCFASKIKKDEQDETNQITKSNKIKRKNTISVINDLTKNNFEFEFKNAEIIEVTKNNIEEKNRDYKIINFFSEVYQIIN